MRPTSIFVRNGTERASGGSFLWELAVLFCLEKHLEGPNSSNMRTQRLPAAAHSLSHADFPFDSPRLTLEQVTDAIESQWDAYVGCPLIPAGTSNVC